MTNSTHPNTGSDTGKLSSQKKYPPVSMFHFCTLLLALMAVCQSVIGEQLRVSGPLPGPSITTQPKDQQVCAGPSTALFTIVASNATSYQWKVKVGEDFVNVVAGEGTAYQLVSPTQLAVTNTEGLVNSQYMCVVSDGTNTVSSAIASIILFPATIISASPTSKSVAGGADVTFKVGESNSISYQWQVDSGSGFAEIADAPPYSGASTSQLKISGATACINGFSYQVVTKGACGTSATSSPASLTVVPIAIISSHPASSTVCEDNGTSFTVSASGATGFQWKVSTGGSFENITNGGKYSNATTATLGVANVSASMSGYRYQCYVTAGCAGTETSQNATLTVNVAGTWLGTEDTEWNNTANWSCGKIPDSNTNVVIGPTDNDPYIENVYDAKCKNLTIQSNASLTVGSGLLAIYGSVTNSGTFNRLGPIEFAGQGQVIPAGNYEEIDITGGGSATLGGNVYVDGLIMLNSGYIKLGAYNLTVGSNRGQFVEQSPSSFIVTDGTGQLKYGQVLPLNRRTFGVPTPSLIFPVGSSSTSYTPVEITNVGTPDVFGVRVIDGRYASYNEDTPNGALLTSTNVNKTWFITEANGGGSEATVTFYWNEGDEQSSFNRAKCFGSHYEEDKWNNGSEGVAQEGDMFSTSLSGVLGFSPFGVGSTLAVLPLKLVSFGGTANKENVALTWETSGEENTAGFVIEESANASNFRKVGFVESLNKHETTRYHFNAPLSGGSQSYYRLKMMDKDGTFAYSRILNVRHEDIAASYQIFPNPVLNDNLSLKTTLGSTGPLDITVIDAAGTVRQRSQVDAGTLKTDILNIPVTKLAGGSVYILQIVDKSTGASQNLKFYKK